MNKAKGRRGKGASREAKKKGAAPERAHARRAKHYEYLDHPADVGFLARGQTLTELFEAAAEAMLDYGWERGPVREREEVQVRARAATLEDLLFSWLSELLYLADAEHWVFKRVSVRQVEPPHTAAPQPRWEARATGHGERFDKARHRSRTYIKAVTYHQLEVEETDAGWSATVYLDV